MLTLFLYAGHKVSHRKSVAFSIVWANTIYTTHCSNYPAQFVIFWLWTPLPSLPCTLSIVRSHSMHLCSRCAKPNYMACNKGRSKFSYNLWEQRIKKRGRRGRGSEQKKQLQNGMLYALRPFPLRRRLINISNPSQNAATTRRANSPRMRVHLFWSHFICSLALVASRAARLCAL